MPEQTSPVRADDHLRCLAEEGVESMLAAVRRRYPSIRVLGIEPGGKGRAPLPDRIQAFSRSADEAGDELVFVKPDETVFVALFLRAVQSGAATASLRFDTNPQVFHRIHVVSLMPDESVVIAIDAGPSDSPGAESVGVSSLTLGLVPRRGTRTISERGIILSVDDDVGAMLGFASDDLVGKPTLDFCHPDFHQVAIEGWIELLVQPGATRRTRQRIRRGDGSWMWCDLVHTNRLHDLGHVVNEMIDVSAEQEAESRLYEREQVLSQLTELLPSGVAVFDLDGAVTFANTRWTEITGPASGETTGLLRCIVGERSEVAAVERGLKRCLSDGSPFSARIEIRPPDDSMVRHCHFSVRALRNADQQITGLVCCLEDVTEIWRISRELKHRAETDGLTGLLNRPTIMDFLQACVDERDTKGVTTAVMFCDLNDFKLVNDLLGHGAGDRLLREIGDYLRLSTRPGDLVGRLGGDEFVIVCPDIGSVDDVVAMATRMSAGLADLDLPSVPGQPMTWSAGIATNWQARCDADELLAMADAAMYEQKRQNSTAPLLFDAAQLASTHRRVEIGRALPLAIADGALQVHYQSVVNLAGGDIVGYEALARWCHNGRFIPPDEFIPLAESKGLIADLGEWVLDRVLLEASGTKERRLWAVNVSPIQLREDQFARRVLAMIASRKVDPRSVVFEVTESTIIEESPTVLANLNRLAAAGVKLAIDDFGAGYSSLHYLGTMPFESLKIDRTFTAKLGRDRAAEAIISCVADLGRRLGLGVVAEGIETPEQAELAARLGVIYAQGFLYDRPSCVPREHRESRENEPTTSG